jgi:hypothetical protein
LRALADELARSHPGAAASLREGLAETVTLQRLGVQQQLGDRRDDAKQHTTTTTQLFRTGWRPIVEVCCGPVTIS